MSKKETKVSEKSTASELAGAFLDANWEERLKEARAKRKQALSGKADTKGGKLSGKLATAITARSGEPVIGLRLTGQDARKAVFFFAGAFGFGLGAVLGIGVLIGWAQQDPIQSPRIAAHQMSRSVLPSQLSTASVVPAAKQNMDAIPAATPVTSFVPPELTPPDAPIIASLQVPHISDGGPAGPDRVALSPLPEALNSFDVFPLAEPTVPKVFIHAPNSVRQTDLRKWSEQVQDTGIKVAGIGRESFRVSSSHVRYYSPETEADAMEIATTLGLKARDFSEKALVPGRIEVWIAGNSRKGAGRQRQPNSNQDSFSWLKQKQFDR